MSEYGKFKLNFLRRDHPPAWLISHSASVGINVKMKVILGQKFQKRSEYGKLKLESLHRDNPPAWVISYPASVWVKDKKFLIATLSLLKWYFWPKIRVLWCLVHFEAALKIIGGNWPFTLKHPTQPVLQITLKRLKVFWSQF